MDVIRAHPLDLEHLLAAGSKTLRPSNTMGSGPMAPQKVTKHELKTRETRELLLQAAEKVFVRDGYESADLLEIAQLAGRTKGAIYAQFKSKEDIFLALVEAHSRRRRAVIRERLKDSKSQADNLAIMRQLYADLTTDEVFGLLLLEFRLYTIRHPDVRKRLADLHSSLVAEDEEAAYTAFLGPPGRGKKAISRAAAVHGSFAMLYALQVEMKFEPALFTPELTRNIAVRVFDAIFEAPEK